MIVKRLANNTVLSLLINFAFALGNCIVGFVFHSWWFITFGAYYSVLSMAKFSVLQVKHKSNGDIKLELFAKKITGILFMFLALCLIGMVVLTTVENRGTKLHEILMIAIAVYSFTKVVLAIIGIIKSKNTTSPITKTLRNISFADAFVSIYSLQRSMLVSFPGMQPNEIQLFNILTGSGVCLLILLLGINLLDGRFVNMAKSKIVKANERIAEAVVGGYKKIEKSVVGGYTKIEDRFVDAYLTKDNETVEEAKARLKNNK